MVCAFNFTFLLKMGAVEVLEIASLWEIGDFWIEKTARDKTPAKMVKFIFENISNIPNARVMN